MVTVLCCSIFLILYALRDNVIFFYSPSEIEKKVSNGDIADGSLIRLGGLVLEDSFQRGEDNHVSFVITDLKNEINIAYSGILPDLFREGQGVIAEGYIEIIGVTGGIIKIFQMINNTISRFMLKILKRCVRKENIDLKRRQIENIERIIRLKRHQSTVWKEIELTNQTENRVITRERAGTF